MKLNPDKKRLFKYLSRILLGAGSILVLGWLIIYWNQVLILKHILNNLSEEIEGRLSIEDGRIAAFHKFPSIQIQLKAVKLFENDIAENPLVEVEHIYLGLDFWSIWSDNYEIKELELEKGQLSLLEYPDKSFNVRRAIRPKKQKEHPSHFNIHSIRLKEVGIHYQKTKSMLKLAFDIQQLGVALKIEEKQSQIKLQTKMKLSLWQTERLAILKDKPIELKASLTHEEENDLLKIVSAALKIEKGVFELEGSAKLRGTPWLDVEIKGKPQIASLLALIPVNMQSFWKHYHYKGKAHFEGKIKGNLERKKWPEIRIKLGAERVRLTHKRTKKRIKALSFSAYFDNSLAADQPYFSLENCSLKLDSGYLNAYMHLYNRKEKSLDAEVDAQIDLGQFGTFLGIRTEQPLTGMLDLQLKSKGDRLEVEKCQASLGSSDLSLQGYIQQIAGIFSWTEAICEGKFNLEAKHLNLEELTSVSLFKNAFNEKIKNFKTAFYFQNTILSSNGLKQWIWELYDLRAYFEEYGHQLHTLNGKLWQTEERFPDFRLRGKIDRSDIELKGTACHQTEDYQITDQYDVELKANRIALKDLIGRNKHKDLPKDYENEQLENFRFKSSLFLKQGAWFWQDMHFYVDALEGKLLKHNVNLAFFADIHYKNACMELKQISGTIGRSDLWISGEFFPAFLIHKERKRSRLQLLSNRLDVDQLWEFKPKIYKKRSDAVASNFQPFSSRIPKVGLRVNIKDFKFRGQYIQNLQGQIELGEQQDIQIKKLNFEIAGGQVSLQGRINGEDPNAIYFEPEVQIRNLKMEQLWADAKKESILSENVVGTLNAQVDGRIQLHSNLKPIIEGTHLNVSMNLLDGRLENYEPLLRFAKFFQDKNLRMVRFDTLKNELIFKDNVWKIPKMEVNSTLGYISLWGEYELEKDLDIYARVPFKLVRKAVFQALFKKQQAEPKPEQEDEIEYDDPNKLNTYIYVNLKGRVGTYKLKLIRNPDKEKRGFFYRLKEYKKRRLGR